jgi:hypothetical protein
MEQHRVRRSLENYAALNYIQQLQVMVDLGVPIHIYGFDTVEDLRKCFAFLYRTNRMTLFVEGLSDGDVS